jgi:CMP-N-acetylneuraminic acid synthetase
MPIRSGKVYAVIPARSGSTSVKDKNIRLLGGYPMMAYSIAAAKMTKEIDRTFVSTDSERYREIALGYGAEAPFLRPAEISGPYSTDLEFMKHIITWLEENEGELPEYWVHLRPTSPFRDPSIISKGIGMLLQNPDATCLRSAHPTDLCPMKWFKIGGNGYYETLCDISPEDANGPRQNFPPVYIPDGYVDVLKTEFIINNGKLHGDRILAFQVPPIVDVDYEHEFQDLENSIGDYMGPVMDWLKNCRDKQL